MLELRVKNVLFAVIAAVDLLFELSGIFFKFYGFFVVWKVEFFVDEFIVNLFILSLFKSVILFFFSFFIIVVL